MTGGDGTYEVIGLDESITDESCAATTQPTLLFLPTQADCQAAFNKLFPVDNNPDGVEFTLGNPNDTDLPEGCVYNKATQRVFGNYPINAISNLDCNDNADFVCLCENPSVAPTLA